MIKVKPGVKLNALKPQMTLVLQVANEVYQKHNVMECWITRGNEHADGSLEHSLHYIGHALDFRSRNIPQQIRIQVRDAIMAALGDDYQSKPITNHIHIEYQPRG
jgi:hypothetical protein